MSSFLIVFVFSCTWLSVKESKSLDGKISQTKKEGEIKSYYHMILLQHTEKSSVLFIQELCGCNTLQFLRLTLTSLMFLYRKRNKQFSNKGYQKHTLDFFYLKYFQNQVNVYIFQETVSFLFLKIITEFFFNPK